MVLSFTASLTGSWPKREMSNSDAKTVIWRARALVVQVKKTCLPNFPTSLMTAVSSAWRVRKTLIVQIASSSSCLTKAIS